MTREEKIELLNKLLEIEEKNDIGNLTRADRGEFQQWINDAIEQEPCEDAISRQSAIDALTGWETEPLDEDIERTIKQLPSVTPQVICPSHGINCKDCHAYEPKSDVLDKIKAEIEDVRYGLINDGLDVALKIIDKHITESEETE